MKRILIFSLLVVLLSGCIKGKKVDYILYNAQIHTFDFNNSVQQAMAIKDGKIVEIGPERQILNRYRAENEYDAAGKSVYPGFSDAHTHLLLLAYQRLAADLSKVETVAQASVVMDKYHSRNQFPFAIGQGLRIHNREMQLAILKKLNEDLPNFPIFLITNDMHGALLNQKAIEYLQLQPTEKDSLSGYVFQNGKFTGILREEAFFTNYPKFPKYSESKIKEKLFEIQDELLQYGIVAVHEMGWDYNDYQFFKKLAKDKRWLIRISAYLLPTEKNFELLKNGKIHGNKIDICGLKVILDGTFSSKTAAMNSPYADGTYGQLNFSVSELDKILSFASNHELQVATHTIGDKSAELFLQEVRKLKINAGNLQWRMEHLQKINDTIVNEIKELGIIPSIQPFHAVSDIEWLPLVFPKIDQTFYANRTLYHINEIFAIGSDLPIATFNPFEIIWAGSSRRGIDEENTEAFNPEESISVNDLIKAYAIFNPQIVGLGNELGSLEAGHNATFFVSETPINESFNSTYDFSDMTFIKGKKVYSTE